MTIIDVKQKLYDFISEYWGGATIVWGATSETVNPKSPLVVLQTIGAINRPAMPVRQAIDGELHYYYWTEFNLQIDLYTKGKQAEYPNSPENTAINDLLDFCNFFDSEYSVEWSRINEIKTYLATAVQDLSQVINGNQWQYRAMCQYCIRFTQEAKGTTSLMPLQGAFAPTNSGGGTSELANMTTGYFDTLDVQNVTPN